MKRDEAWYREYCARNDRFKSGAAHAGQSLQGCGGIAKQVGPSPGQSGPLTPQRLAAPVLPASTPPRVSGVGEAPYNAAAIAQVADAPLPKGVLRGGGVSKYRNKPTNGYPSIKQYKRALELKLMQEAGQIRGLREEVPYLLIPKQEGERACSYVADFVYEEWGVLVTLGGEKLWSSVVEDVKSPASRTETYIVKRKLMLFVHKIRIRET